MLMNKKPCLILSYFIALSLSADVNAIDVMPDGAFAPPPDLNAYMVAVNHVELGDKYQDGNKLNLGTELSLSALLLRYTRTFTINDNPAGFYIQPSFVYADPGGSLSSNQSEFDLGDTALALAYWPYVNHDAGRYFALAGYLVAPTGDYDSNRLINPGGNRWSWVTQAIFHDMLSDKWGYMFAVDSQWFQDNDDYRLTHQNHEQDPLYLTQATLNYKPDSSLMFSVSYFHNFGAKEKLDGVTVTDDISNGRVGLTMIKRSKAGKLIVRYVKGLEPENGFIKEHQLYIRWHFTLN